jgi:hypothetical protein
MRMFSGLASPVNRSANAGFLADAGRKDVQCNDTAKFLLPRFIYRANLSRISSSGNLPASSSGVGGCFRTFVARHAMQIHGNALLHDIFGEPCQAETTCWYVNGQQRSLVLGRFVLEQSNGHWLGSLNPGQRHQSV